MAWMFSLVLMTTLEGHVSLGDREVWGPFRANRRVPNDPHSTPPPSLFSLLTLLDAGVWRLNLGRGGRNPPPHLFEVLLVPWTQKMVPNPKTRRD